MLSTLGIHVITGALLQRDDVLYKADPLVNGSVSVDDFFFSFPQCEQVVSCAVIRVIPAGADSSCAFPNVLCTFIPS